MHFLTEEQWQHVRVQTVGERFLYLRWQELFDETTYLSWQIRSADPQSICNEITDCAVITQSVYSHHPNISHLIDELEECFRKNRVISGHQPQTSSLLSALRQAYEKKTRNEGQRDTTHLLSILQKMLGLLCGVKTLLLEEIEEIVLSAPHEKKRLYAALSLLAVMLKNEGYSYFYLKELHAVFRKDEPFEDKLRLFRQFVTREEEEYLIHFLVKLTDLDFPQYQLGGPYRTVAREELLSGDDDHVERFLSQDQEGVVVAFRTRSLDQYGAISTALAELRQLTASIKLYRKRPILNQIHPYVLVVDAEQKKRTYRPSVLQFSEIPDSRNLQSNLEKFHAVRNSTIPEQRRLLDASLKYFGESLDVEDTEIKFLNLWIALETLFQESDGDSIIGRILHSLPQIVSSNYTSDLLRETAKDLSRNDAENRFEKVVAHFPNSNCRRFDPYDLFLALSDKENGDRIASLLDYAANSELLVFRIYSLWKSFFRDRNNFSDMLQVHLKNVEWQILRLYRARNSIMHKGKMRSDIEYLTHHLYHYYLSTIHKCINYLRRYPKHSIQDALLSTREDFEHVRKQIRDRQPLLSGQLITFDPQNCSGSRVWQDVRT